MGSYLARMLRENGVASRVVSLDNLKRRGSELAMERLRAGGVDFVHGDARCAEDFEGLGEFDAVIDCAAEPSVQAGYEGGGRALVSNNLGATVNCLEFARAQGAALFFLSSSRVYPIDAIRALPLETRGERWVIEEGRSGPGAGRA